MILDHSTSFFTSFNRNFSMTKNNVVFQHILQDPTGTCDARAPSRDEALLQPVRRFLVAFRALAVDCDWCREEWIQWDYTEGN